MEEVTAEMSKGTATFMLRSIISTSKTNKMPAMGALKAPAIAPAAPQPKRMITHLVFKRKKRAIFEAMALPVKTMGASKPTLPPKATVIEDVSIELQQ